MTPNDITKYNGYLRAVDLGVYGLDIRMPIYEALLMVGTDCGYDQAYAERYPDLNGDGKVDVLDANIVLAAATRIAQGEPSGLTPEQERLADTNRDGIIDSLDASLILLFDAKCVQGIYENNPSDWGDFINDIIGE